MRTAANDLVTASNGDVTVRDKAEVLGCMIDRLDMERTLERCVEAIESGQYTQHMAINAAKVVAMHRDPKLREVIDRCGLVSADGQAVVWASKLLGDPVPERVAGIDLMERLIALAERRGYRLFILGARRDVVERAVSNLRIRYPRLVLAGYRDGYFREEEQEEVARAVRDARADILFVAISSPLKEYFLGTYGKMMGVPFVMGVGGAIDIVAGVARRAPKRWQRMGLEWLYRLIQEPSRLFGRYAVTNAVFIGLVVRELAAGVRRNATG